MRYLKCFVPVLLIVVLVGCTHPNAVPVVKSGSPQSQVAKVKLFPRVKHPGKLYLYGSIVSDGVIMHTRSTTTTWIESDPIIVVKMKNGVIHVDKIAEENADALRTYSLRQGDLLRYRIIHKENTTDNYVLVTNADSEKD